MPTLTPPTDPKHQTQQNFLASTHRMMHAPDNQRIVDTNLMLKTHKTDESSFGGETSHQSNKRKRA